MSDKSLGIECPKLTLETSRGQINLHEELNGKWSLIYFYPKDDTPGCTKQACAYRNQISDFDNLKVKIWGVSSDGVESHRSFSEKFSLNFPLIVDSEKKLASALNVQGRDTFLFNPNGKVSEVWRKVNPEKTVEETLETVKERIK